MDNPSFFRSLLFFVTLITSLNYTIDANAVVPNSSSPFSVSVSHITTGEAELVQGQQRLQRSSWLIDGKASFSLNRQWSLGFNLGYADLDYDWQERGATLFDSNLSSWQQVDRYSAGFSLSYRQGRHWMFMLAPKLQYAYADTASAGHALSYGVVTSAMYRFEGGDLLGVGVAYLNDISEVRTLPYLVINWQIDENWRLGNPFTAGFTGPAGLELSYRFSPDIEFGLGTSKRTQRFLVEDDDITVEVDEWVSFVRVGWEVSHSLSFNVYAGYYFDTEMELSETKLDNSAGTESIENQGALALAIKYKF
ncbi:DUF6268 family outer membrane beta-barrel protein [uncultured Shewanella sp.]|uniref:DUF6268 family outer membrane beta-barrel protein n=1 Tax=uncultured Shewanella sp. TaxID=173975 RepID=UPI00262C0D46|nr:DUF6268 family outer membrane beta-barrel protein [uncultured Shewanella sp.]